MRGEAKPVYQMQHKDTLQLIELIQGEQEDAVFVGPCGPTQPLDGDCISLEFRGWEVGNYSDHIVLYHDGLDRVFYRKEDYPLPKLAKRLVMHMWDYEDERCL